MDKELTIRACTLLAQAYAFAKDGNEETAGRLLVQAAENDGLDEVMDGVAQAANNMADGQDDDDYEEVPNDLDNPEEDEEDEEEAPEEDPEDEEPATVTAHVELPESVARLAARALV